MLVCFNCKYYLYFYYYFKEIISKYFRLLEKCLSENLVRKQDQSQILEDMANNLFSRTVAFDYLEANWNDLNKKFGNLIYTLPNMVNLILSKLNSAEDIERVLNFTQKHQNKLGIALRAFEESLDSIVSNKKWMNRNLNVIVKWLSNNQSPFLNEKEISAIQYRLPKDLSPINYDLFIQPFFKSNTMPEYYNASIRIDFACLKNTNRLVLNMKSIELYNKTLLLKSETDTNFNTLAQFSYSYNNKTYIFTAEFDKNTFLSGHNYSFYADFKSSIKDDNIGIYRSSYSDFELNEKK